MYQKPFRLFSFILTAALSLAGWWTPAQPGQAASPAAEACDPAASAWIGTVEYGLNCLDQAGWHAYTQREGSLPSDKITAAVACQDKGVWVAYDYGLITTDGGQPWKSIQVEQGWLSIEGLACDGGSGVWAAHYQGVSHYDGARWTTYDYKELGSLDYADQVKGVAVGPDGKVWVVTSSSIAMFDGKSWTVYEKDKGFERDYHFSGIVVDSKSMPWVAYESGVLAFGGKTWEIYDAPGMAQIESMTVDTLGHVWVGTGLRGVSMFDGKDWTAYDHNNSKLTSDHVTALAADAQGRIWIGTEWGLNVFDGKDWQAFHMSTSGLLDDDVHRLAVSGKGPELPDLKPKKTGTLTGAIMRASKPVSDAMVELCAESFTLLFIGKTPCSDQSFTRAATTGEDGKFTFGELPVGRYHLGVKDPTSDGKWISLTAYSGLNLGRVEVKEEEQTDLGDLDLSKVK